MAHPRTTVKRNIATCPACGEYLWAEIDLTTKTTEPTWDQQANHPVAYVTTTIAAMRVTHDCKGRRAE